MHTHAAQAPPRACMSPRADFSGGDRASPHTCPRQFRETPEESAQPCAGEEQSAQDSGASQPGYRSGCMCTHEHVGVDTWSPATVGRDYPPTLAVAQTQACHSPPPPNPSPCPSRGLAGGQALLWAVFAPLKNGSRTSPSLSHELVKPQTRVITEEAIALSSLGPRSSAVRVI